MDAELMQAARAVRERAHAPYSEFAVGAAVRNAAGVTFAGANVENASFPEGCCAETAAMLFWALLASGQIRMRKVDGWQTLAKPSARRRLTLLRSPPEQIPSPDPEAGQPNSNTTRDGT